jgi:hypothetical protein
MMPYYQQLQQQQQQQAQHHLVLPYHLDPAWSPGLDPSALLHAAAAAGAGQPQHYN